MFAHTARPRTDRFCERAGLLKSTLPTRFLLRPFSIPSPSVPLFSTTLLPFLFIFPSSLPPPISFHFISSFPLLRPCTPLTFLSTSLFSLYYLYLNLHCTSSA